MSALTAFQARYGPSWSLASDPATGRPRRLAGGAIPLVTPPNQDALAAASGFLAENAALLGAAPPPAPSAR